MDVPIVTKRCSMVVKLEMGLYYGSLKVMEFMMELHYRNPKRGKASVEASPHGLLYPCGMDVTPSMALDMCRSSHKPFPTY